MVSRDSDSRDTEMREPSRPRFPVAGSMLTLPPIRGLYRVAIRHLDHCAHIPKSLDRNGRIFRRFRLVPGLH